ncbi:hypothetical protein P7K49_038087 [Saguinus oedipus]|uniref:Uncharacterized protein n=1 Tax=Saguinus oedipus TaxID=9490 RepID=A0ABQ9TDP8_SAGOE|nr:hypothetical protein P7K49_038087 [Saguinus oedipus]
MPRAFGPYYNLSARAGTDAPLAKHLWYIPDPGLSEAPRFRAPRKLWFLLYDEVLIFGRKARLPPGAGGLISGRGAGDSANNRDRRGIVEVFCSGPRLSGRHLVSAALLEEAAAAIEEEEEEEEEEEKEEEEEEVGGGVTRGTGIGKNSVFHCASPGAGPGCCRGGPR